MHFIISSLRHASTALVLEVIEFVVCSLWSPHFVHLMVLFHPALALIIISLFVVCSPSSPLCCLLHIIFNGHRDVLSAASPLRPAYPAAPVSQFCLTVSCYPLLGTLSRLSPPAKRERKWKRESAERQERRWLRWRRCQDSDSVSAAPVNVSQLCAKYPVKATPSRCMSWPYSIWDCIYLFYRI